MRRLLLAWALFMTACGGTATKKDEIPGRTTNPDLTGYVEAPTKVLITSPDMTKMRFNELYADTTDLAGVVGTFTFTPVQKSELVIASEEVAVTEPSQAGAANPTYILGRPDGSKENLIPDEAFVVGAEEAVTLRVSQANPARAHAIDVLFGVNIRPL